MSKYIATRKDHQCPVCDDSTGKCRVFDDSPVVLCMNLSTSYQGDRTNGYKFLKQSKNQSWGVWVPDQGENTFDRDKWQETRRSKQQESDRIAAEQSQTLTKDERSQAWNEILDSLTLAEDHRQNMLNRGFTSEQIESEKFRTANKYQKLKSDVGNTDLAGVTNRKGKLILTNSERGIITPIKDSQDRIIGCQVRLDVGSDGGRYRWLSSAYSGGASPNLRNGELPIGIYGTGTVCGITEGASIKPQLAAHKLGLRMIGASGRLWTSSPEQLNGYLEKFHTDKSKPVRIFPDAGSHSDDATMNCLQGLWELLKSWGYKVNVAWWGQFHKEDGDIDEISQEQIDEIEYISTSEFEHLGSYALRKADKVLNRRYLAKPEGDRDTFDFIRDIPKDKFGVGCKSYQGTGKNYLQKIIADNLSLGDPKPILYITQLTNLINQASQPSTKDNLSGLGLVNIYDIENAKSDDERRALIIEARIYGVAMTYDSLHKLDRLIPDFTPHSTFLDEAESGCECLLDSSTDIQKFRTETIALFGNILQRSKATYDDGHMYMFDSDLTNLSISYFCSLAGQTLKDAFIIRNDYKLAKGRIANIYNGSKLWVDKYQATSDRTICFSNSQAIGSTYSAQNLATLTGDSLVIDSQTTKDKTNDAYRALQGNVTKLMGRYQRTVHTSSMGIGVSIEEEGLFDSKWCNSFGLLGVGKLLQGTNRYRPNIPLHIFVSERGNGVIYGGSTNWKTIAKQCLKNRQDNINALAIADIDDSTGLRKSVETWAKYMARRNYELANYRKCVERQLRLDGYTINYVDGEVDTTAANQLKELKQENVAKYCESVPLANIDDELEIKRLEKAKEHTPDQRLKLAKKKLVDKYQIEVTPELVKEDLGGIYSKLTLQYFLTIGAEYLPKRETAKLESLLGDDKLLFAPDANKKLLAGKIAILRKIGLPEFLADMGDDPLTNDDHRVQNFNQRLISDWYRIPLHRHLGIKIDLDAKPITNIEKVLNAIAKKVVRDEESRKRKKAGEYQIKPMTDLQDVIFEAWLTRDAKSIENPETTTLCRKFPNKNISNREFATFAPVDNVMVANGNLAIDDYEYF